MQLKFPYQDQKTQAETVPFSLAGLAWRPRGRAWMLSLAVHGLLLILALWEFERTVEEPPPTIRLVFVEPRPPPPLPLGAPQGKGSTPVPNKPPPVVEKPKRKEPQRLKVTKKTKKQQAPQPQPEPASPAEPEAVPETNTAATAEPQPGIATGVVGGIAGGVAGGVASGVLGGVVGGRGTGPIPVGQVAKPPVLISRVMPDYPELARLQRIEGLVLLEAILNRKGRIEKSIKVLKPIPPLDEAAIKALRRWRFKPARTRNGRPVRVILEVPIRFVLR